MNQYCEVCQREIEPINLEQVESGEHDEYIYLHDDVPHPDSFVPEAEKGEQ